MYSILVMYKHVVSALVNVSVYDVMFKLYEYYLI